MISASTFVLNLCRWWWDDGIIGVMANMRQAHLASYTLGTHWLLLQSAHLDTRQFSWPCVAHLKWYSHCTADFTYHITLFTSCITSHSTSLQDSFTSITRWNPWKSCNSSGHTRFGIKSLSQINFIAQSLMPTSWYTTQREALLIICTRNWHWTA